MDSAKDLVAFAKRDGKVLDANTVHAILDAHYMGNVKMEHAFAKLVSMESIAHFRLAILWVQNKEVYALVMDPVNQR